MLGEELYRRDEEDEDTPARLSVSEAKPPAPVVVSIPAGAMPVQVPFTYASSESTQDAAVAAGPLLPARRRRVSPELPHLQPASSSPSSRYPHSHVAVRRSYAAAVLARERAIEDAQEA